MGFSIADMFHSSPDYGQLATQQENQRQAAIKKGTTDINNAFAGFTPKFYQDRAQAYTDFAMPQLDKQYTDTRNQIGFGLANRNLVGSGAASKQFSDLNTSMESAKQGIVDTGIGQSQQLENSVNSSKDQLLSNLYSSADPSGAAAGATSTAASFAQPSTFGALTNQFNGLLNQYYTSQLINSYRPLNYVSAPSQPGANGGWATTTSQGGN